MSIKIVAIVDTLHCVVLGQGSIETVRPIFDIVKAEYTKISETRGNQVILVEKEI